MVNMILRDPVEGSSLFAKILNFHFLSQAPCQAHRNRVQYLGQKLRQETIRLSKQSRPLEVFNLGCGPAGEIQEFLAKDDLCEKTRLTLLDFNTETLDHTGRLLQNLRTQHKRSTEIKLVQKSVNQILKEAVRDREETASEQYDFIYCAGLFDYLSDRICKRLMEYFYAHLAAGGLLVTTNVDPSNPIRFGMECFLEWHLVYRDRARMLELKPEAAEPEHCRTLADSTGVNVFLEIRKPSL
jgi:extracellular factor (EF) 3-hydroxypalmitic acid methyl ester biosynthesis protein